MEREIIREIATAMNSLGQLATRYLSSLVQNSENRNRRATRNNRPRRNQNTRRSQNNRQNNRNQVHGQNQNRRIANNGNFFRTAERMQNMNIEVTFENTQAANIANEVRQPNVNTERVNAEERANNENRRQRALYEQRQLDQLIVESDALMSD